jgi:hypothetical protein
MCIFLVVLLFVPLWFTTCVRSAIMVGVCQFFSLLLVGDFTAWAKNVFSTLRFVYLSCTDFYLCALVLVVLPSFVSFLLRSFLRSFLPLFVRSFLPSFLPPLFVCFLCLFFVFVYLLVY